MLAVEVVVAAVAAVVAAAVFAVALVVALTKVEVLKLVYVVKEEAVMILLPTEVAVGEVIFGRPENVSVAVATRPSTPVWVLSRGP